MIRQSQFRTFAKFIAILMIATPLSVGTAAVDKCESYKVRLANQTAKDASTDIPSWVAGQRPCKTPNEDGKAFATRLLSAKYGVGSYPTGAGSEYSKIQKYGDRAFYLVISKKSNLIY
jgi:hypothetical protein